VTHGLYRWFAVGVLVALFTCVFLALWIGERVLTVAARTAPHRMRAGLARRRAYLVNERSGRTRESGTSATLATVASTADTQARVEPDDTGLFI